MNRLNPPLPGARANWNISDESNDECFDRMLSNTRELRNASRFASEGVSLTCIYFLPFSGDFTEESGKRSAAIQENPLVPTAEEFTAFFTNSLEILSRVQSIQIRGSFQADRRWLLVCELRGKDSETPLLLLCHPTWILKARQILLLRGVTESDLGQWQSDCELIMPPSSWDIDEAWRRCWLSDTAQ